MTPRIEENAIFQNIIEFQVLAFSIWWLLPGHSCVLQLSVIFEEPKHSWPPFSASIFGSRTFMRIPPPHSLEHSPIFHSFHSQSTVFQYANFILYHYRGMQSSKNDLKIKKNYLSIHLCCRFRLFYSSLYIVFLHWLHWFSGPWHLFGFQNHILWNNHLSSTYPIHNQLKLKMISYKDWNWICKTLSGFQVWSWN